MNEDVYHQILIQRQYHSSIVVSNTNLILSVCVKIRLYNSCKHLLLISKEGLIISKLLWRGILT